MNTFTVAASNTTSGETATTSPSISVKVTDPPILTANDTPQGSSAPPSNPPSIDHVVALFNQFIAAGLSDQHGAVITNAVSQVTTDEQQFLANSHHG